MWYNGSMKAGGNKEGTFRERYILRSLASAFPPRCSYVVSFLLFYTYLFSNFICNTPDNCRGIFLKYIIFKGVWGKLDLKAAFPHFKIRRFGETGFKSGVPPFKIYYAYNFNKRYCQKRTAYPRT